MFSGEAFQLVVARVGNRERELGRLDFFRERQQVKRRFRRAAVRSHEAARAEFDAAEIARHDENDIADVRPAQDRHRRFPRRSGRLAVVGQPFLHAAAESDAKGVHVMRGIGHFGADAGNELPRGFDALRHANRRNESGAMYDKFRADGFRWNHIAMRHAE